MNAKRHAIGLLVCLAAAMALGGCQFVWAVLELSFPKQRVPPEFNLPKKKVLVFPDDMLHPVSYPPIKRALAARTNALLAEHKLVAETIPYDRLADLQVVESDFNGLAVASVGRKLGADLVIYVSIDKFSLKETPEDTLWQGEFAAKVRVVDVRKGKGRLWPDEPAGFPVQATEPVTENASETYGEELSRKLADGLGERIAGLFRAHYVERSRLAAEKRPIQPEPQ